MRSNARTRGTLFGLGAAVSFGIAAPVSKLLLEDMPPQLLAGLLYAGAAVVLLTVVPVRVGRTREARLRRSDVPRLAALTLTGGIVAPVLLLVGLERVSGSAGSLLLNLEGPFAVLISVLAFREHLARRSATGAVIIFGAGALLALGDPAGAVDPLGAACIGAACLLWGIDNNLTQALTLRDPFLIVLIKAGAATCANVTLAVILGASVPALPILVGALALGAVSYGASVLLDAYALRILGAAREAAFFATAPFVGALVAIPVLGESPTPLVGSAALLMALGLALMIREEHVHEHFHRVMEHDHLHIHDEHHRHTHGPRTTSREPHSHPHRHPELTHAHPHVSDIHHRHRH